MDAEMKLDAQLLEQFVQAARRSGRDPNDLLTNYIREFLKMVEEEDEFLNLFSQYLQEQANKQVSKSTEPANSTLSGLESES